MDTIESMRVLLKEYQNNLNSHSILENVTSSNNFVAAVNDIKNNGNKHELVTSVLWLGIRDW